MRNTLALLAIVAVLPMIGCNGTPAGGSGISTEEADAEYRDQVDAFNRQTEQQEKLLAQQESELEPPRAVLNAQVGFNERYEKLLTKWEEQARRMDAVLEADEKRVGVKP